MGGLLERHRHAITRPTLPQRVQQRVSSTDASYFRPIDIFQTNRFLVHDADKQARITNRT
jgi:hypothetical protein